MKKLLIIALCLTPTLVSGYIIWSLRTMLNRASELYQDTLAENILLIEKYDKAHLSNFLCSHFFKGASLHD